ncbi:hypothetical protein GGR35_003262 [Mucilaginibacter phyllosphaerae]|uniref:Uncharacterized protein n=1 Tax=Mucilaginibacter phyllosphaerae TaxID=1812349 RepID=A0ABR6IC89_9SPHI|nr:hypothetical protein [Mucilaginibacter phyllosphaerae]
MNIIEIKKAITKLIDELREEIMPDILVQIKNKRSRQS